ncbi:hypothetical protein AAJ76_440003756 [Vairimorpha ceranae]|uniref:Uncharacterized protein n=1 Tax=Vairimorpha ceranae TaxID=40302 RepID=A0A0F9WB55_9MICR|nr:hypothetical protein AAJ76_440003756 [Vairimorpha ceranae]KKO74801.1 hypothetical protein AAJ76_440003756 [Vairimorpha ceranae]
MLYWLQTIFCSMQFLDFDLLVDLENTSEYTKIFKITEFCEKEDTQQKIQEQVYTEDKNFYESPSNLNILNELACYIDEGYNNACKSVECDFSNFLSSITPESDSLPNSCISNTPSTTKCEKQSCTMEHLVYDTTHFKEYNSSQNNTLAYSHINTFCNNNTNLFSCTTQNDLLQGQLANPENIAFLQTSDHGISDYDMQNIRTNYINKPNNSLINTQFGCYNSLMIMNSETGSFLNSVYKNDNNVEDKEKKFKTSKVSNIQINGNEITLKPKRNTRKTIHKNQFTAKERELYKKYNQSEKRFRNLYKRKIKNQISQFIKKLEIFNLSDDLKQKSILALRNLSSFLDTISEIYINTKKKKNKEDFINSLNLACYQFSRYEDVSQKLLIFKLICKNIHKVDDSVFCCISSCDFYEVNWLIFSVDRRFNSFYRKLLQLREIFDKK